jgi:KUP system potassium uptake protein
MFMRQVDDFAIATDCNDTAHALINDINKHLRLPIHTLGEITRYNGMDIEQTNHYVKIHCKKYIMKLQQSYAWLEKEQKIADLPLPFPSDAAFISKLIHHNHQPLNNDQQQALEAKMGIKFQQAMGEIMFPMIKCRPDISPHAIILSQFMNNPAEIHYKALKDIIKYLMATKEEGIHYWRSQPHVTLPLKPLPKPHHGNYHIREARGTNSTQLVGYVDSDWATNTRKRTSMTGMVIMCAGGAVGYKSKFQTVIANSSTEAEFVAACEMGKMILC